MKMTERLVKNCPASLLVVLRTQKVGGSSGQCQMVARVNIGQEEAALFLRTLSDSACDNPAA